MDWIKLVKIVLIWLELNLVVYFKVIQHRLHLAMTITISLIFVRRDFSARFFSISMPYVYHHYYDQQRHECKVLVEFGYEGKRKAKRSLARFDKKQKWSKHRLLFTWNTNRKRPNKAHTKRTTRRENKKRIELSRCRMKKWDTYRYTLYTNERVLATGTRGECMIRVRLCISCWIAAYANTRRGMWTRITQNQLFLLLLHSLWRRIPYAKRGVATASGRRKWYLESKQRFHFSSFFFLSSCSCGFGFANFTNRWKSSTEQCIGPIWINVDEKKLCDLLLVLLRSIHCKKKLQPAKVNRNNNKKINPSILDEIYESMRCSQLLFTEVRFSECSNPFPSYCLCLCSTDFYIMLNNCELDHKAVEVVCNRVCWMSWNAFRNLMFTRRKILVNSENYVFRARQHWNSHTANMLLFQQVQRIRIHVIKALNRK